MKKLLFTLCCFMFAIVLFAQTNNHIKFMGIPLTGTITQFQAKLVSKGCTYDKATSSSLSKGIKLYNGTFVGNKVKIFVYYDIKTKIVYRVKAVVNSLSEDIAEQKYSEIKDMLSQKYGSGPENVYIGTKDGKEAASFVSTNVGGKINGTIGLYIVHYEVSLLTFPYDYSLHIDYYDRINSNEHDRNQLEEL